MYGGPTKFAPWQGCTCYQCRMGGGRKRQKYYKEVRTHRRYRRESKERLRKGDYDNFVIGTGYRS